MYNDVTEEMQTQEDLKESEERYRSLFENSEAVMLLIHPDSGQIAEANPAACEYYGWTLEEIKKMHIYDINTLSKEKVNSEMIGEIIDERNHIHFKHRIASGEIRDVQVQSSPIKIKGQKYFYSIIHDETERKTAQQKLTESRDRIRKYIENAPYAIFAADKNGKYTDVNEEACRITGYTKKELLDMDFLKITIPEDRKRAVESFKVVKEKGSIELDLKFISKNKGIREWNNRIVKIGENEFLRFSKDITEKKELERKISDSEEKYHAIFDYAALGISNISPQGKILNANKRFCEILGYSLEEIKKRNIFDFTHPDDIKRSKELLKSFWDDNKTYIFTEKRYVRKDGETVYVKLSSSMLRDEQDNLIHTVTTIQDITQEKKAEKKHRKSEKKSNVWLENSPVCTKIVDLDFNLQYMSNAGIMDLNIDDITEYYGSPYPLDFYPESFKVLMNENLKQVKETGEIITQEAAVTNMEGRKMWYHSTLVPVNDENGRIDYIMVVSIDTTERRLAEEAQRQSEEEQRLLLANLQAGVVIHSADTSILDCNPIAEKLLGLTLDQMRGKVASDSYWEFVTENGEKLLLDNYPVSKVLARKKAIEPIILGLQAAKYNDIKWLLVNGYPIFDKNRKIEKVTISFIDISEAKKSEMELLESRARYSSMISNISDVIGILDKDGMIIYKSPNVKKLFGWETEELIGAHALKTVHPDDEKYIQEELEDLLKKPGLSKVVEYRYLCKDNNYKHINLNAINLFEDPNINGILLNYHDISNRVKIEEEKTVMEAHLRNQQKLESIGTLAGGVAHEINNPINGIMNYSQLIKDDIKADEVAEYAAEIIYETKRVSEIVKNLLEFSRQEKQTFSKARISDILNNTLSLINTIIKQDQIDIQINIPKDLPDIKCRSQQIQQILMNLFTNARDALNKRYKGYDENKILKFSCKAIEKESKEFVRITVEDHGSGIEESIQDKIFDPFFTTKRRDEGTGLGLAISYGITKEHHGELTYETKKGEFTRFNLDLPVNNGWNLEENG
jgi:PAS domain S-box-containing protein